MNKNEALNPPPKQDGGSVLPIALLTALCETTRVELRQRIIDETTANYIDFSIPGSRTGQY